ncbi:MAG: TIGR03667 family PPOX class F420-dependent oxidoreductase [Thermomicrobiales bacterium]|nr:TIGR03667 family PPOX class F420-dependent oxidoreductase [Thermomicrobiales bacterium]
MLKLDPNDPFQARAIERLTNESTAWLTTVGADGTPQPNPIWFLWDGADKVLIYSVEAAKPRHINARPRVAFAFNTDAHGENVVIFTGSATVDRAQPSAAENQAYLAKYGASLPAIGYTETSFAENYSAAIVVTLEKLRGF